jgi:hypothetical protein
MMDDAYLSIDLPIYLPIYLLIHILLAIWNIIKYDTHNIMDMEAGVMVFFAPNFFPCRKIASNTSVHLSVILESGISMEYNQPKLFLPYGMRDKGATLSSTSTDKKRCRRRLRSMMDVTTTTERTATRVSPWRFLSNLDPLPKGSHEQHLFGFSVS